MSVPILVWLLIGVIAVLAGVAAWTLMTPTEWGARDGESGSTTRTGPPSP